MAENKGFEALDIDDPVPYKENGHTPLDEVVVEVSVM